MDNIYVNVIVAGILSALICGILVMLGLDGRLLAGVIVFASPGMVIGAAVTILDKLKRGEDEKKDEEMRK